MTARSEIFRYIVENGSSLEPYIPPVIYDRGQAYFSSKRDYHKDVLSNDRWDGIGTIQYQFMIDQGLEVTDTLLDVGCGWFRGGVHFIDYLDDGNYYAVEKRRGRVENGIDEVLPEYGLDGATFQYLITDNFDFGEFDASFDYAIAQSVFTHLSLNQIVRCLVNMSQVLEPDGEFYATFFESDEPFHLEPIEHTTESGAVVVTHMDSPDNTNYHYHIQDFEMLCDRLDLRVEYIGDWDHPRNQKMLKFTRNN